MKVYKVKDTIAILWFFIIILFQYNKYYNTVLVLLTLGMLCDLMVCITNAGDVDIDSINFW